MSTEKILRGDDSDTRRLDCLDGGQLSFGCICILLNLFSEQIMKGCFLNAFQFQG